jgi:hypothetical protein
MGILPPERLRPADPAGGGHRGRPDRPGHPPRDDGPVRPIERVPRHDGVRTSLPDLSLLTSLLSIVVAVAFFAGIAYACVAIPSQTQLQEDLPEDVRVACSAS